MNRIKTKLVIILITFIIFGVLSAYIMWAKPSPADPLAWGSHFIPTKIDTVPPKIITPPQPVINDVKGKKVLFIGDSHTAADYGWQHQLCKKTKMTYLWWGK